MNTFSSVIAAILMLGLAWFMYTRARRQPELFARHNLLKSLNTMGILALILIAFIWLCVVFLRG